MKISEIIIRASFHLSVLMIEKFHDMKLYEMQVNKLRNLEEGTLGKDIASCLDKHKLRLVPGYESHDLKHVLLGYEMTPIDEIRMQAFMLGNGNVSLPSVAIFFYGFALLPHKYRQFYKDFKLGLYPKSIKSWAIKDIAHEQSAQLRKQVINIKQENEVMKHFATKASIIAMIVGVFGMTFCLPYLFSPILEDLVGAGFPFVGAAILFAAGLLSFSILNKRMPVAPVESATSVLRSSQ